MHYYFVKTARDQHELLKTKDISTLHLYTTQHSSVVTVQPPPICAHDAWLLACHASEWSRQQLPTCFAGAWSSRLYQGTLNPRSLCFQTQPRARWGSEWCSLSEGPWCDCLPTIKFVCRRHSSMRLMPMSSHWNLVEHTKVSENKHATAAQPAHLTVTFALCACVCRKLADDCIKLVCSLSKLILVTD